MELLSFFNKTTIQSKLTDFYHEKRISIMTKKKITICHAYDRKQEIVEEDT